MNFGPEAISAASLRIKRCIHVTPVFSSKTLNEIVDRELYFKAENLQKTGSFKARGAVNAVKGLLEQNPQLPGVVTHSSGNHGQALSYAAREFGVRCTVVIPHNAPQAKKDAIKAYGAELVLCEATMVSRIETCKSLVETQGMIEVSSHNDFLVMAGAGTIALEFLTEIPDLDAILVSVAGGGMLAGIATWVKHVKPDCKVFAVEPKGKELGPCLASGERLWPNPPKMVDTIADGIRVQQVGTNCFPVLLQHVEKTVFTVDDEEIKTAMKLAFNRLKLVIEPSAGATVAAALGPQMKSMDPSLRKIGVVLCGGNVDMDHLPWM